MGKKGKKEKEGERGKGKGKAARRRANAFTDLWREGWQKAVMEALRRRTGWKTNFRTCMGRMLSLGDG
jgi:hypothetical protein